MASSIRMRTLAAVAMGIAGLVQPAISQRSSGPPTTGGGNRGGSTTGTTTNTNPTPPVTLPEVNNGIYLSGKVMMDDGTIPPISLTIERVCNSQGRAQAYTDGKGRFSFQMGQTVGVFQDASEQADTTGQGHQRTSSAAQMLNGSQPNNSNVDLSTCELRAVLAGYRSDTVSLANRRPMDDPDVGTLILHRLANVEGSAISMTSLLAPNDAKKAFEKGRQDLQKNKQPEAFQHFQKAVDLYPKYAAAWFELGRLHEQQKEIGEARKCYTSALAADSRFLGPYLPLAQLAANEQKWAELADYTGRLLKLDAVDYPGAFFYDAVANLNLGKTDIAEKSARDGEKIDKGHRYPRLEEVLALSLARKMDYAGAAEHMRAYVLLAPDSDDVAHAKMQLAKFVQLSGATDRAASKPDAEKPAADRQSEPK